MKSFDSIGAAGVLAIILGLTGASCTTQVTPATRLPAPDLQSLTLKEPDAATKATVQAAYGKLPLHFEANQGQTDEQVKFLSRGSGYTLFLTPSEAVLALHKPDRQDTETRGHGDTETVAVSTTADAATPDAALGPEPLALSPQPSALLLRMKLVGANPTPAAVGLDELPGKSNYFIGNDPKNWHTDIPTYTRVQYQDVYPGIDLIYYGNQRQLEYDFVVAPGADPQVIRLAFDGLVGADLVPTQEGRSQGSPLQIDDNGDLILHTAGGELRLHKPRIYQEINGVKQPIPGGYVLLGPGTRDAGPGTQQVGFQVVVYDASQPLIIDPALSYSTYLGGSGTDHGMGIAVDSSGNAYVMGRTTSTNFPTASPLQATNGGGVDIFVTKLNVAGSALVYSTYLGGSDEDDSVSIAVDSSGSAYVVGNTFSTNFPTASPFQPTYGGGSNGDGFVTKLNPTGSALVYSTYLGGSGGDQTNMLKILVGQADVKTGTPFFVKSQMAEKRVAIRHW